MVDVCLERVGEGVVPSRFDGPPIIARSILPIVLTLRSPECGRGGDLCLERVSAPEGTAPRWVVEEEGLFAVESDALILPVVVGVAVVGEIDEQLSVPLSSSLMVCNVLCMCRRRAVAGASAKSGKEDAWSRGGGACVSVAPSSPNEVAAAGVGIIATLGCSETVGVGMCVGPPVMTGVATTVIAEATTAATSSAAGVGAGAGADARRCDGWLPLWLAAAARFSL